MSLRDRGRPLGAVLVLLFSIAAGCDAPRGEAASASPASGDGRLQSSRAVRRDPSCGPDMVVVEHLEVSFCVDSHESPGFGRVPTLTDLDGARLLCEQRGARLCTEQEWERACRGESGHRYPYGAMYDRLVCQTEATGPVETGGRSGCRSEWGAYDMSGNAAEWVDGGFLKGGDSGADDFASRCSSRARSDSPGAPTHRGVRCCRSLSNSSQDER